MVLLLQWRNSCLNATSLCNDVSYYATQRKYLLIPALSQFHRHHLSMLLPSIHPNCCVGPAHGTNRASGFRLVTGGIISIPVVMMSIHCRGDGLLRGLRRSGGIISMGPMSPPASWAGGFNTGRNQQLDVLTLRVSTPPGTKANREARLVAFIITAIIGGSAVIIASVVSRGCAAIIIPAVVYCCCLGHGEIDSGRLERGNCLVDRNLRANE